MSGPAVHHIIAKEFLLKSLKIKYSDPTSMAYWDQMDTGKFAPIYHLGAQGPDFLFFNMNDWPSGGVVKSLAQHYWEIQEFMEDFVVKVKELVPVELWEAIDTLETLKKDAVERSATLSEIESLCNDVKNNIDGLKILVETKIKEYVTDSFDIFNELQHPLQHGQQYSEWWWFDILHYRRTGRYLGELLKNSSNYTPERAYALGYMTHYATDTVGHSFVNAISGGPFRTHAQRHKVVENHQDVWAFNHYINGEFITSNIAKHYIINDDPVSLPQNLKTFILQCINNVYYENGNPLYGKSLSEDDLDISYKCWLKWFTGSTNDHKLPHPKPYSLTAEIAEEWKKFTKNVGDIGDYVGNSLSGGGGLLGFLKALAALIAGPILLAGAAVDFLIGEITTIGAAPMRFFLSLTYEAIYNAYQNFRQGLVMNGFGFPSIAQLNHPFTRHMINSRYVDKFMHNANSLPAANSYPSTKFNLIGPESHLVYPFPIAGSLEIDKSAGFPNSYFPSDPSHYMTDSNLIFQKDKYDYYRRFTEINPNPDNLDSNFNKFSVEASEGGLGNAVNFSEALYAEYLEKGKEINFIDFNLDSDRGYGFKCWRKVTDTSFINKPVNDYKNTNVPIELDKKVPNTQTDIIDPDRSVL